MTTALTAIAAYLLFIAVVITLGYCAFRSRCTGHVAHPPGQHRQDVNDTPTVSKGHGTAAATGNALPSSRPGRLGNFS